MDTLLILQLLYSHFNFGPHLGPIQAAFGPHLGRIWATFGPYLGRIWTFEAQKNTIFGIPNIICSKSIQKWLIIWERAYIFLNHGSNFLNLGHSGQENITSGYYGPSIMWPGSGRATQKPWPTGQISGRVLARPSPIFLILISYWLYDLLQPMNNGYQNLQKY